MINKFTKILRYLCRGLSFSTRHICNRLTAKRLLYVTMIFLYNPVLSQIYSSKDIPILTPMFFKGKRPDSSLYAASVYIKTNYKYFVRPESTDSSIYLKIIITIQLDSMRSYFPKSDLKEAQQKALIKHELGHVMIGYIVGNSIEKKLSELSYSNNYQMEIEEKFQKYFKEYDNLHNQYDNETNHGTYEVLQILWDKKLLSLLDEKQK
jgi:hypothetical protein